jgi:diguanylate cyclase (GGDEF)-like protein/PAS domain S-box-containing protein
MKDNNKTKAILIEELAEMRQRIVQLEKSEKEHAKADRALRESEQQFRTLVESNPHGVQKIDICGIILFANKAHHEIYEYEEGALVGRSITDFLVPGQQRDELPRYLETLLKDQPMPTLYHQTILTKSGKEKDIEVAWNYLRDNKGSVVGFLSVLTDITERKKADVALSESRDRFRALVETTSDWIWEVNDKAVYTYASPKVLDILGYKPEEVIGKTPFDFMTPEEAKRVAEIFSSITASQRPFKELENANIHKRGDLVILETSGTPFFDVDGTLRGYRGIDRDITDRKRMEDKLREAAITDDLTGLLNRRGFFTLADQQCKLATRNKRAMALIYLDLDDLKIINDELGHEAGDQALEDIANIFKNTFRESDIMARIGGDEFAVLLTELHDPFTGNIIIDHLQENIRKHNKHGTRDYELSVTNGIAIYDPERSCSISELIYQADKLMYKSKKNSQF